MRSYLLCALAAAGAGCGTSATSGPPPAPASSSSSAAVAPGAVTSLAGASEAAAGTMQLGDAVAIPGSANGASASGDGGTNGANASGDGGTNGASSALAGSAAAAGGDATVMPGNAFCAPVSTWSADWATYEDAVLALTNQARAAGATCGGKAFAPAPPLVADAALRCAARAHALDMAVKGYFAHDDPTGVTPWQRMAAAGFTDNVSKGENILAGMLDPQAVVQGWLHSPGHCANMMGPDFTRLGVGLFYGSYGMKSYWTQDFAG